MSDESPEVCLRDALLRELAASPEGVSLPRLCKRLNVRMSVLLRTLAWLGDEAIGELRGSGLVRVEQRGEVQVVVLTSSEHETAIEMRLPD
ncbi:MAG: hypothetical protein ACT4NL_01955 [Pseudomarimonas sp.]